MTRGLRWTNGLTGCFILMVLIAPQFNSEGSRGGFDSYEDPTDPMLHTLYGSFSASDIEGFDPFGLSRFEDDTRFWIVQFDGPVGGDQVKDLLDEGFLVHDYFPDFAYVVDLNGRSEDGLMSIDRVATIAPFRYWLRTSPDYIPLIFGSERSPTNEFIMEFFDDDPRAMDEIGKRFHIASVISSTRIVISASSAPDLLLIDGVKWVEPRPIMVFFNDVATDILDLEPLRGDLGLDGTGQIVAISDSGLDTGVDNTSLNGDIHLDLDNRVTFSNWAGSSPDDNHGHGTHVAGSVGGDGTRSGGSIQGMAYNSSIFFQAIMDDYENIVTPGNLSLLFKESYEAGARVHTNSWGYQGSYYHGAYTTSSYDVDWSMFHYPQMLILYAAGNDGTDGSGGDGKIDPNSVSPPATAKSTLTVGASENQRGSGGIQSTWGNAFGFPRNPIRDDRPSNNSKGLAAFSSRGPTDDGRIKPEVVAPGTNILSTRSSVPGATASWGSYNQYYTYMGGTSMATPITAGMAALVRQYLTDHAEQPDASGALVKAAIVNGAVDMTPGQYGAANPVTKEINSRPDNDQGFGRANLAGAVSPGTGTMTHHQDLFGLRTGENLTRMFKVFSSNEIRFTLAWSDYPGSYFSGKQLVNDLDLRLTSPSGDVYCGNDLTYPHNTPDRLNPTETVAVADPEPGWWKLEVIAYNVPRGRQHFAVVGSGDITGILANSIRFDREYYSTDDEIIRIDMTAMEIGGSGSVSLKVTSTSTPDGVYLNLIEGEEGKFSAELMTSNVTTALPGRIYVRHNDTLRVEYINPDYDLSVNSTAVAVSPLRAYMYPDRDHSLVFSMHDRMRVKVLSEVGAELFWRLEGTGIPDLPLHDDGSYYFRDEVKDDGNYSGIHIITSPMKLEALIVIIARDPYLGDLLYPQVRISIDTSVPRFPRNLTAQVVDVGNSLILKWDNDNVTDRSHYDVFMNVTDTPPRLDPAAWRKVAEANAMSTFFLIDGLVDGVPYHFRIATVNMTGISSSYSSWASAVPWDSKVPDVRLKEMQYVLGPMARLEFETDPDTTLIEVEYYIDDNLNGIADDGRDFVPASTGSGNHTVEWDTRSDSGGPGDTRSMIIRFRAQDEVPNISPWTVLNGFSVDNTGPGSIFIIEEVPRITRQSSHSFTGETEALGSVEVKLNGILSSVERVGPNGRFYFNIDLEEGENHLVLDSYDRYGAIGANIESFILLDTILPIPLIDTQLSSQVNISNDTNELISHSYDPGDSDLYNRISNVSWELRGPQGGLVSQSYSQRFWLSFSDLGLHRIKLTVIDVAGNRNETEMRISVVDMIPPVVVIDGPLVVEEDTIVTYLPFGMIDNDPAVNNDNDAFFWSVYDGAGFVRSMGRRQFTVTFPDPGYYNVTLNVTDRASNIGSATVRVHVLDVTPPTMMINGARQVWTGKTESYMLEAFDNDEGLNIENAVWELLFLDDISSSPMTFEGRTIEHVFDKAGNYTFSAVLSDRSGNNGTHSISIQVLPSNDGGGNGKGEMPWLLIAIAALIIIVGSIAVAVMYVRRRQEISEVDWEEDEAWSEE